MNTTTLNITTLDGGVIIKKGEGGGVTINNQDKVVDITENGTTEVVADSGFTGLGKVTINTEVSGGESGGGGGLSYFAIDTSITGWDAAFAYGSFLAKVVLPGEKSIQPTTLLVQSADENLMKGLKAIATDVNANIFFMGQLVPLWGGLASTIEEFISIGVLTPITKEEFYKLD